MNDFKQITLDKKPKEASEFQLLFYPATILVSLTILFALIYQPLAYLGISIATLHFIFRDKVRTLYPDWVKQSETCGSILIDEKFIKKINTHEQRIELDNVTEIHIHHNYIQGEKIGNRDIVHNGLARITMILKNEEIEVFQFLIETDKQLKSLQLVLKAWYKQKIILKESFGNYKQKTILLQLNLDYKMIQNLKQELGISTFY